MAKLDGKSQSVMIPPVLADYLEVLVGQRVVAGNFPLAHREMCFEEFRPLCSGQQFVCWNAAKFTYQPAFQGACTALPWRCVGYRRHR
jgi:hypothetical protein